MKTGKTLQELAVELDRQVATKRDFVADASEVQLIEMVDGGTKLRVGADNAFDINKTFHEQLAGDLDIPKKYYDRMLVDSPELLRANANHWLQKSGTKRMVRTLDNKARAYLSDKYRPLDNYDLVQVALPVLTQSGCRIESAEVTESRLYLKAVTERITMKLKVGDIVQAGIVISNSEIGKGRLKVEPLIFTLRCLNGMIAPDYSLAKNHVGRSNTGIDFEGASEFYRDETRLADDRAFWMKVKDTLSHVFEQINFERIVQKLNDASENKITVEPKKVVEMSAKRFSWSEDEGTNVLAHLVGGGDMTQYGLHSAVTRAAQDLKSYDRSTEFERIGGQIIELPRTEWENMALAA